MTCHRKGPLSESFWTTWPLTPPCAIGIAKPRPIASNSYGCSRKCPNMIGLGAGQFDLILNALHDERATWQKLISCPWLPCDTSTWWYVWGCVSMKCACVLTCVFDIVYVSVCVCVFGLIANHFSRARAVVPSELINQSYCSPSLHGFPNKDRDSGHKMMEALPGHNGGSKESQWTQRHHIQWSVTTFSPPSPSPLSFN